MEKYKVREILHHLDLECTKFLRPRYKKIGLTVSKGQPRILKCLLEQGAMPQRELADNCMLDVATMSRTLDKLEAGDYLERQPNPSCRRSYLICITEEGKKKAVQAQNVFRELDEQMWQGITMEEMEALYEVLNKIRRNLQMSLSPSASEGQSQDA